VERGATDNVEKNEKIEKHDKNEKIETTSVSSHRL
jgi:hypothetical protein